MTLFERLKTLFGATANEAVDAAEDANKPAIIKQQVRELEEATDEVFSQKAAADARVTTLDGDVVRLQREADEMGHNIDLLLTDTDPTNDDSALVLQQQLEVLEGRIGEKKAELEEAKGVAKELAEASAKLENKHTQAVGQVRNLELLDRRAKAKARTTAALEAAGAAVSGVDGASVDDVASRLREDAAVEDAKFDRALGVVTGGTAEADVAKAKALAALAARKARLAAAAPPA